MKKYQLKTISILITLLFFTIIGCEKDSLENNEITKEKVTGLIQKGPFINGTQILMADLNNSLEQNGKMFSTQITNDYGAFEVNNVVLSSSYVEFSANGYYYNEVSGMISSSPLTLFAFTDVSDISSVNVNILTHLEKQRVEFLVKEEKMKFAEAKKTAQAEILSMFGFEQESISGSESLNISSPDEGNGILLAISIILQGNRSVGALTELLAKISNDLVEDGVLSDENILTELKASTIELNFEGIRNNLVNRYQELGVGATIPNFEKYINSFLTNTAGSPFISVVYSYNVTNHSATLSADINPNSSLTSVIFEYGENTDYEFSIVADQSPLEGFVYQGVSALISDLTIGTTYHYRVVVENEFGLNYSQDGIFTTTVTGTTGVVIDVDGNSYSTIGIGHQVWMAENLRVSRFSDGTPITEITNENDWIALGETLLDVTEKALCFYNYDEEHKYGAYYTWPAAMNGAEATDNYPSEIQGVCPSGWHLPSESEWFELRDYITSQGGENAEGNALKTKIEWLNENGTDEYDFSAYPAGAASSLGLFMDIGYQTFFWSASTDINGAKSLQIEFEIIEVGTHDLNTGQTVRCIKD